MQYLRIHKGEKKNPDVTTCKTVLEHWRRDLYMNLLITCY